MSRDIAGACGKFRHGPFCSPQYCGLSLPLHATQPHFSLAPWLCVTPCSGSLAQAP